MAPSHARSSGGRRRGESDGPAASRFKWLVAAGLLVAVVAVVAFLPGLFHDGRRPTSAAVNEAAALVDQGNELRDAGKLDDALAAYRKAIELQPDLAAAHNNLGIALRRQGKGDEAIRCYQQAITLNPRYAEAFNNLANALLDQRRLDEAVENYRRALAADTRFAAAYGNLGVVLQRQGKVREAVDCWRQAVRLQPGDVAVLDPLAWVLATSSDASVRNGPEAVGLAERAIRISGGREPALLDTLAAAYAEVGRYPEAVQAIQQAIAAFAASKQPAAADPLRTRLKLYQAGAAYHESGTMKP